MSAAAPGGHHVALQMRRRIGAACMLAGLLSACAVGPDFQRPAPPAEQRYTRLPQPAATVAAQGLAQHFQMEGRVDAQWWKLFQSTQLDALVRLAIVNNPTLLAAQASLRQSQDNLRAGYGIFWPQFDAAAAGSRNRSAPLANGVPASGSIYNLVTVSGTIAYTMDVFGGERRRIEGLAAQNDYQRNVSVAAYLALTANVVNTTIARAGYTEQLQITAQLIRMEQQQLAATQAQVNAGTSAYAAVLSMQSQIATNQALLASLRQKVDQSEHLLALLAGTIPSAANLPDIALRSLVLPTDVPVSLPSDLVRQRPDILQAEALLHITSADIGVATAAMFPSISLSGTYGAVGTSLGNLSAPAGRFWSVGPSISLPLFQGGSLWFARKAALDAYDAALANYRQAVLAAFAQVADCLTALDHDAEALQAQDIAQQSAKQALDLLQVNFISGTVAYIDVLSADVQYEQAVSQYVQATAQRQQDTVALFAALGGGWWNADKRLDTP